MTDLRRPVGPNYLLDKSKAKNFIIKMVKSLRPNKVKDLVFKDKLMWREYKHSSVAHFLKRSKEIAMKVNYVEPF